MKITRRQLRSLIQEITRMSLEEFPRYDPEEIERFPNTAASISELLHADIVSAVYDSVIDDALNVFGNDREDMVLTGIDIELESREADGEEVDMSQVDLKDILRDVMTDIAATEKRK